MTGFVFLALILDIFARGVIGWAISKRLDHRLTVGALKVSIWNKILDTGKNGIFWASTKYTAGLSL